ncbi:GNAT family N-acetyltransferase [Bacillus carboniphilus]|uniref:GNAT family N-acetyltransferase n=1 Tax=Bacillus carboniphilus TaxID=86663 RepID=A0ABY9JXB7_9BACI|nr:GNAT family N-acetyltransferase [Bacillus carboniphilus]WLR42316.1 GNAT family N-acetyltransferase [Bacillus carboniphilus]
MKIDHICNNKGNEIINTERIYMRKFVQEDINMFSKIVQKDEVGKWLGLGKGMSYEESTSYINRIIEHWEVHNIGVWALISKSTNEMLGHCGLRYIDDSQEIELIYLLDPKYWGKGIATEAGNAAVQYAFHSLKVKKVFARVRTNNSHSKNVLHKLGFTFIGDQQHHNRILSYYRLKKKEE